MRRHLGQRWRESHARILITMLRDIDGKRIWLGDQPADATPKQALLGVKRERTR